MEWCRDDAGQWTATVPRGQYAIRGGPGAWWFELANPRGALLATGRVWGSPAEVKVEAEERQRCAFGCCGRSRPL